LTIIKKGGRFSYRNNKKYSYSRNNNTFSYGKFRSKGNVSSLHEKYLKLAKESTASGDRIQAEYYHQFADHYSRLMNENDIKSNNGDNILQDTKKNVENDNSNEVELNQATEDSNLDSIEVKEENDKDANEVEENNNSIETVSFISKPPKKNSKTK
tara:strand:- start:4076 stop:4543 length:468 start_codon:yes stop_codon:yes gene_type:complete